MYLKTTDDTAIFFFHQIMSIFARLFFMRNSMV
jgi:hypothetical protein